VSLRFLSHSLFKGEIDAIAGNVSAYSLKTAFKDIVPDAYDVNLRTPLGSTKINKEMKKTLASDERKFFWYYNNGITILCKSFSQINDSDVYNVIAPRIVNGAQTTDTIISADIPDDDNIALMVRLIPALPDDSSRSVLAQTDLYLNIARYTNSQNPIELPDFRSNELVQKDLHEKFMLLGWFYEHRRGQWEGCEEKTVFRPNGKLKRLTMIELAQRWFSFDGYPSVAIREKLSLFEEDGHYGKIFMYSRPAEVYLIAYVLFEQIHERLKSKITKAKDEAKTAAVTGNKPSITTQNYMMIGRATKLATAHMTAILGKALKEKYDFKSLNTLKSILISVETEKLIKNVYPELEDTLFRIATQLQGEKYKSMHRFLSEKETFDELFDLFKYVLEKELDKERDILAV
jgi:hypothetical protein